MQMATLNPIKEYFHRAHLKKKLKSAPNDRAFINLESAKTIGILYDATTPTNNIVVTRFAELLKQKKKQVTLLGYVNDKKPVDVKVEPLFYKKDLNF